MRTCSSSPSCAKSAARGLRSIESSPHTIATRPSSAVIALHQAHELQAAQAIQLLQPVIKRNGAATVCETGFNAGHSTLLFLALAYADARSSRGASMYGFLTRILASCVRQRAACPRGHARYEPRAGGLYTYRVSCGTTGAT